MKLQINRNTEKVETKGLLSKDVRVKYTYSLRIQLFPSDEEKYLWHKYHYLDNDIPVSNNLTEFIVKFSEASSKTSFSELLNGRTWSAGALYVLFTDIPTVIAQQLRTINGLLLSRENWDGADDVLDLTSE